MPPASDVARRAARSVLCAVLTGVAAMAQAEEPTLRRIELPAEVNVSASYGITVMNGAPDAAREFLRFVLSPVAQALLAKRGFAAPVALR
jgi:ABC-type molybdate transport system substrate-binding protein